mmetsp:Transcript_17846/g.46610  ORF Transcript_17846/g.46610 Transcript_17846/m.46610 type:complete len:227 (+) Transcript_17846:229-909(+)|eukprot:CAMPEP_0182933784 /NCGR_PEP_ID=MMETSP0105_2-20130417/34706_1 /TAXON_ID=81532 ORGANISM="Acanthoeca-like sp., Strain 10tr" /NCGR_SAMPLE_ID=MMETSP0105_2 /ASSEMBLY_ACC=CAM_ASM_000205 /LENGTH=226 /DNA_ID=CAMNT_0025072571 /DNA_START=207 /DNA_END=887 /DNA_ORIENTATION=-
MIAAVRARSSHALHCSRKPTATAFTAGPRKLFRLPRAMPERGLSSRSRDVGGFVSWYNSRLAAFPLITTAVSTAIIGAAGDAGSQLLIEQREWDATRTLRFGMLGLILTGPTLHLWYGALYKHFSGVSAVQVLKRVALDQALFAPTFTAAFVSILFATEGRSLTELRGHMERNYAESVCVNWVMWIPAQVINFRFIPSAHSVLFANFVAVFWNSYLSWNAHRDNSI